MKTMKGMKALGGMLVATAGFSGPFWNHLCLEHRTLKLDTAALLIGCLPWFSDDHVSPIEVCKSLLYPFLSYSEPL